MRKQFLFLFLLTAFFATGQGKHGQQRIDSLLVELPKMKQDTNMVMLFNDLSYNYQEIDPKKGLQYGQKALALTQKINWRAGYSTSYSNMGYNCRVISKYDLALFYFNKALNTSTNKSSTSVCYHTIATIYFFRNDYSKALDYNFKALKLSEETKDKYYQFANLSDIGGVYFGLENYKKALFYYEKAKVISEKLENNDYPMLVVYNNLGETYSKLDKNNKKSLEYYLKSLKISNKIGYKDIQSSILFSVANYYFNQKEYPNAIDYNNQSHIIADELGNKKTSSDNYSLNSSIYVELAKQQNNNSVFLNKALQNSKRALLQHQELRMTKKIGSDYEQISTIYELQGDLKNSLLSYKTAIVYKDSVFNSKNKETLKNIEDKRSIELRDEQLISNKLTLDIKEKQKVYFVLGLIALAVIGCLLFNQNRIRRKKNQKLELLNMELDNSNTIKNRLLGILNHDLRGPVNSFIHYIQLQKENPELLDKETKNRIENTTLVSAKNLLNSMEDILLWTKDQMQNFEPHKENTFIKTLFDDTQKYFLSEEKIKMTFETLENLQIITDKNYLKTIIRNLTANAIRALKKSDNPIIIWKAWYEPISNKTYLTLSDNGPGGTKEQFRALFDQSEITGIQSGLGLHLIRDLAKAIDCKIEVSSILNQGTNFKLEL